MKNDSPEIPEVPDNTDEFDSDPRDQHSEPEEQEEAAPEPEDTDMQVRVAAQNGVVGVAFSRPAKELGLPPRVAKQIAGQLLNAARKAKGQRNGQQ